MWRFRAFVVCFVAAFFLGAAGTAAAYHTRFVSYNSLVKIRAKNP